MMSWGPGNGSRRKKPVEPAAIARISHTAAAQAAAPGKRGAGSVEAVIGHPRDIGCIYNYWRGKGVPRSTRPGGPRVAPPGIAPAAQQAPRSRRGDEKR